VFIFGKSLLFDFVNEKYKSDMRRISGVPKRNYFYSEPLVFLTK